MPTQYHLDAIILHERPFRDYDRIVSTYTKELGKLDIHAVGTRKITSKLAGHLVPIRRTRLVVVQARFLPKVIAAVSQYNFRASMRSEYAMASSGAVLRLVNDFTKEGQIDEDLFSLLVYTLKGIDQLARDEIQEENMYNNITRAFFISFVSLLGYTPKKDQCFVCKKAISQKNRCQIEDTLYLCTVCLSQSGINKNTFNPNRDLYIVLSTVGK